MKKGTVIKHPSSDWGRGVVVENFGNDTIKVRFQKVGLKTLSLKYVTPVILEDEPLVTEDELERIIETERIYFNERFVDIYNDIKSKYPKHLIFIHNGCYFEILYEDAEECSKLFGYKIYERSEGVLSTGTPIESKQIWHDLRQLHRPYIIVRQLESGQKPHRQISEIYP